MSEDERRQRLIDLGPEALADALLELTVSHADADGLVTRLVATPDESIKRFKIRFARLKNPDSYRDWRGALGLAQELSRLLKDLRAEVTDPSIGVKLVADFIECDGALFECCDDSNGHVGEVFQFDARDAFIQFATACPDKTALPELVMDLYARDRYGARSTLLDAAHTFLPESALREMTERFLQNASNQEKDSYEARRWFSGAESLAKQLHDPVLFERVRLGKAPKHSTAACLDIAQVYMQSGDAKTALSWLQRVSEDEPFEAHERDTLLLSVHTALSNHDASAKVAWRLFRRHRDKKSLDALLAIVGAGERDRVIEEEAQRILADVRLSYSDAEFLIQAGRIPDAENYILKRASDLNGDLYPSLLILAEGFEKANCWLPAYVVYKTLLESILSRSNSKYYHHGVKYLGFLDNLERKILDWKNVQPHKAYLKTLREKHFRKSSFWSKYKFGR